MLSGYQKCNPVSVRTQIVQPPVDTSVLLGYTAELQCKVSNDPSVLYDIAWFHNSQYVYTTHFHIIVIFIKFQDQWNQGVLINRLELVIIT